MGPGPWAHRGQGPWAHGPWPILKIFDFLSFFGLSAQYFFLNFWISDGPFCSKTPHKECSHMDPLIITSSLKSVKLLIFTVVILFFLKNPLCQVKPSGVCFEGILSFYSPPQMALKYRACAQNLYGGAAAAPRAGRTTWPQRKTYTTRTLRSRPRE